jgi:UDP:flavonoid glycosyltransferase YjiC (YdhE family)
MKFVLSCNGSRGDVQPAMALGGVLAESGHDVTLAVPPNLVTFAAGSGLDTRPCGINTDELLDSDLVKVDLKSPNPVTRLRAVSEITLRGGSRLQHELLAISSGSEAIIGGSAGQERAANVGEALGIPYVPLHYCPVRTNSSVSLFPALRLPAPALRVSWTLIERILWHATASTENALREELDLRPVSSPAATRISSQGLPEIQAYDPVLFPGLAEEWGGQRPLVGFLNLTPGSRKGVGDSADSELLDWLDAGPAPLYVGFGSMKVREPAALAQAITVTAQRLGLRVLLASGGSDLALDTDDERLFVAPTVDHEAILPRCAGAVHHGGAGSTAATLRAGLPTAICWLGADQPMWGRQITRLGAGVSTRLGRLDPDRFTSVVGELLSPARRDAARRVSSLMIDAETAATSAAAIAERVTRAWTGTGPYRNTSG